MAFSNFKTIGEVLTIFQVTYTEDNFISDVPFNITDYFREDLELMMLLKARAYSVVNNDR